MPVSRPRKILFTAAAAAGLAAGGAGLANAATTSTTNNSPQAAGTTDANEGAESPSYTGSVTVPDNGVENDAAESAQLQGLTTITPDQASQAALTAVPGTAATPVLENENGSVVYGVEVTTATGTIDVKVDAGNGTVLAQDTSDGNEKESANKVGEANEANETNETGAAATQ